MLHPSSGNDPRGSSNSRPRSGIHSSDGNELRASSSRPRSRIQSSDGSPSSSSLGAGNTDSSGSMFSKAKSAPKQSKAFKSRMRNLIIYPPLRRSISLNLLATMLYMFGGLSTGTLWFRLLPLRNEATELNTGFPFSIMSFGPRRMDINSHVRGIRPRDWSAQACDPALRQDFVEWLEFMKRETWLRHRGEGGLAVTVGNNRRGGAKCVSVSEALVCDADAGDPGHRLNDASGSENLARFVVYARGSEVCAERAFADNTATWSMDLQVRCGFADICIDESGLWCQQWKEDLGDEFYHYCGSERQPGQPSMASLRSRCRYSCGVCRSDASVAERTNVEAETACAFRTSVVDAFSRVKVTILLSAVGQVLTSLVMLSCQWKKNVVAACAVIQLLCLAAFAFNFLPMCFWPAAAPPQARSRMANQLRQSLSGELASSDARLAEVHRHFLEYLGQATQYTPELRIVLVGFAAEAIGLYMTFAWWMRIAGHAKTAQAATSVGSNVRGATEAGVKPFVQGIWRCLKRCGLTKKGADMYASPWRRLGDRPPQLPPAIGRVVGDIIALPGHYFRMYEWDGFLGENRICSDRERKQMEGMGIQNRSIHNLLAWRRSVLVLCVFLGCIVVVLGVNEVLENMDRQSLDSEALQWPTEWEDFLVYFRFSERSVIEGSPLRREATMRDYLEIMGRKLVGLLANLDAGTDQWMSVITAASEWLTFFCIIFALISWMFWSSSARVIRYAAFGAIYTPIVLSVIPSRYLVRNEAWIDLNVFVERVARNVVQHLSFDMTAVDCWQTIDAGMGNVWTYQNATINLCSWVLWGFPVEDGPAILINNDLTPTRDACHDWTVGRDQWAERFRNIEYQARGTCVGMQEAFFDARDPEITDASVFNRTIVALMTSNKAEMDRTIHETILAQQDKVRLYAGVRAAVNTFLRMIPSSIVMVPSILLAAWRVRLLMPLSRLPGIIIMSLPWIYCPILWVQFLWFWQLMSSPLLCVSMLTGCFGLLHWVFTSYYFRTNEPMPADELTKALQKQGWVDKFAYLLAGSLFVTWYIITPHELANFFKSRVEAWIWSGRAIKSFVRISYKFLVARVAAMDFIMGQIMSDHLFDLGIERMRQRCNRGGASASSRRKSSVDMRGTSLMMVPESAGSVEGVAGDGGGDVERYERLLMGNDLTNDLNSGIYGMQHMEENKPKEREIGAWERVAMLDVVQLAEHKHSALNALVDINYRCVLREPTDDERQREIEMAQMTGDSRPNVAEPEGRSRKARPSVFQRPADGGDAHLDTSQQADFHDFMQQFRPEYSRPLHEQLQYQSNNAFHWNAWDGSSGGSTPWAAGASEMSSPGHGPPAYRPTYHHQQSPTPPRPPPSAGYGGPGAPASGSAGMPMAQPLYQQPLSFPQWQAPPQPMAPLPVLQAQAPPQQQHQFYGNGQWNQAQDQWGNWPAR